MSGFDPLRHDWWPGIAGALRGEWPRDAAMMDLRWWAVEVRLFGRSFPSRPQFMARWGWTERRVRDLLAATEQWQDPLYPATLGDLRGAPRSSARSASAASTTLPAADLDAGKVLSTSSDRPANVPRVSPGGRVNLAHSQEKSGEGPADVPVTSGERPHARSSTDTNTNTTTGRPSPPAGDEPLRPGAVLGSPPPGTATSVVQSTTTAPASRSHPGYSEAIEAWNEEHKLAFGLAYPWVFNGRDGDGARVKAWLGAALVTRAEPGTGISRLRAAMTAYFRAVKAGSSWPTGEPAQTRHFTRELARWLQTDPAISPRPSPSPGSPRSRVFSITELLERRASKAMAPTLVPGFTDVDR